MPPKPDRNKEEPSEMHVKRWIMNKFCVVLPKCVAYNWSLKIIWQLNLFKLGRKTELENIFTLSVYKLGYFKCMFLHSIWNQQSKRVKTNYILRNVGLVSYDRSGQLVQLSNFSLKPWGSIKHNQIRGSNKISINGANLPGNIAVWGDRL